ncbi:undecaprenyldiphospho-muramoylpentapeptide beta-N-acetylglucosaminyltransferase [Christensenellaceae bacterium OttesenSCG-928-K19]|nr:undecaprenyldiphospho-muramoylpentapeptide beta-N-acetylglucosaminyltransferase [Christensenellaceae bacterium OttesenSCG-928-K19]
MANERIDWIDMSGIIVLTGGGSAGHVTPNLALVDDLKQHDYEIHYIGTEDGIERTIVRDLPYHSIEAGKLRRYLSKENIKDFFKIFRGYRQAKKILKDLNPRLVFAKGGFVSVPVVWAAAKLGIPTVLHESDYSPGLANRLCARKARKICLSFDVPNQYGSKSVVTGSPVRSSLLSGNKEKGLQFLGFKSGKPVLLIMGGSLGAKAINDAVDGCIDSLTSSYCVVHLRGKGNLNESLSTHENYRQFEFLEKELADVFSATDLALSRAGANAVFEYLTLCIPPLLIPLPLSASRGDQLQNAAYFKEHGYAHVLQQEELTSEALPAAVGALFKDKDKIIKSMKASGALDGTANVLKVIYESVR